jgi:hypothetical protein
VARSAEGAGPGAVRRVTRANRVQVTWRGRVAREKLDGRRPPACTARAIAVRNARRAALAQPQTGATLQGKKDAALLASDTARARRLIIALPAELRASVDPFGANKPR